MNLCKKIVTAAFATTMLIATPLTADALKQAGTMRIGEGIEWPCSEAHVVKGKTVFHFKVAAPIPMSSVRWNNYLGFEGQRDGEAYSVVFTNEGNPTPANYEAFEKKLPQDPAKQEVVIHREKKKPKHPAIRHRVNDEMMDEETKEVVCRAAFIATENQTYLLVAKGTSAENAKMFFNSFTPLK